MHAENRVNVLDLVVRGLLSVVEQAECELHPSMVTQAYLLLGALVKQSERAMYSRQGAQVEAVIAEALQMHTDLIAQMQEPTAPQVWQ